MSNPNLDHDISIPFTKVFDFDSSMVTAEIMRVIQSKKEFLLSGQISVNITHVEMPRGGEGIQRNREIDFQKYRSKSRSIHKKTQDGMCCARAIVVAKAFADKLKDNELDHIKCDRFGKQTEDAIKLCNESDVVPYSECGVEELKCFDKYSSKDRYQLFVADALN